MPPRPPEPQPRCGCCGRFVPRESGFEKFEEHMDVCPVGGYYMGGGRVRRGDGTIRLTDW